MGALDDKDSRTGEVFDKYCWTAIDQIVATQYQSNIEETHGYIPGTSIGLVTPYALRPPRSNYELGATVPLGALGKSLFPWTLRYLTLPAPSGRRTGWWKLPECPESVTKDAKDLRSLFASLKKESLLTGFLEKQESFLNCIFNHPRNTRWRAAIIAEKKPNGKYAKHPGEIGIVVGHESMAVMGDFELTPEVWVPCSVRQQEKPTRPGQNQVSISGTTPFDPVAHAEKLEGMVRECVKAREAVDRRLTQIRETRGAREALKAVKSAYDDLLKKYPPPVETMPPPMAAFGGSGGAWSAPPPDNSSNPFIVAKHTTEHIQKLYDLTADGCSEELIQRAADPAQKKALELKALILFEDAAIDDWAEALTKRKTITEAENADFSRLCDAYTNAVLHASNALPEDQEIIAFIKKGIATTPKAFPPPKAPKRTIMAATLTFAAKGAGLLKRGPSMYLSVVALSAYSDIMSLLRSQAATGRAIAEAGITSVRAKDLVSSACPEILAKLEEIKASLSGGLKHLRAFKDKDTNELLDRFLEKDLWLKEGNALRLEARAMAEAEKKAHALSTADIGLPGRQKRIALVKSIELLVDVGNLLISISDTFEKWKSGDFMSKPGVWANKNDWVYLAGLGFKPIQLAVTARELLVGTVGYKAAAKFCGAVYAFQQAILYGMATVDAYCARGPYQGVDGLKQTAFVLGNAMVTAGNIVLVVEGVWAGMALLGCASAAPPLLPVAGVGLIILGSVVLITGDYEKYKKVMEQPAAANVVVIALIDNLEKQYKQTITNVPSAVAESVATFRKYLTPEVVLLFRLAHDLPALRNPYRTLKENVEYFALSRLAPAEYARYPYGTLCAAGMPPVFAQMLSENDYPMKMKH